MTSYPEGRNYAIERNPAWRFGCGFPPVVIRELFKIHRWRSRRLGRFRLVLELEEYPRD